MSNEIETRDELVERVAFLLDDMSLLDITETAEKVVATVRAAAWQEFEAAMLSEATLDAACRNLFHQIERAPGITWEYVCKELPEIAEEARVVMKNSASALLAAIAPEDSNE